MSGALPMRSAAPAQVAAGTMLRRWRKLSTSAKGKASALAPLSDRKRKSVCSSAPVSASAAAMRPMPRSILSIWAAYACIRVSCHAW